MAINIKWTGIEQWKYGLTARWYGSQYYGNDVDVDAVGYYNPTTNPLGHGGPTRPFATASKFNQDANVAAGSVWVWDSGNWSLATGITKPCTIVGDGYVVIDSTPIANKANSDNKFYNLKCINCTIGGINTIVTTVDFAQIYGTYRSRSGIQSNIRSSFIEVSILGNESSLIEKCNFLSCSGSIGNAAFTSIFKEIIFINCSNLTIITTAPRPSGTYKDFSAIFGTVKSNRSISGKTTGVTVEDFKADGNYFVKSYSEVDLFGNPSGSGASVTQLQTLFNNYFSPTYLDTWQDADFSLKPTSSDLIKFGGLNGSYIGALPVGYRFGAADLWNTYKDAVNTSNIDYNMINQGLVMTDGQDVGTYRSIRISLPKPITCDLAAFFANLVYNVEGTVKQGVANQRIDTTVDMLPDKTKNQRVVYDYKLSYAPNSTDQLSAFKNFELNRTPWIDASGRSMLDELYIATERQRPIIQDFIIEFTLRKVIID